MHHPPRRFRAAWLLLLGWLLGACAAPQTAAHSGGPPEIILATTTSTVDSGLLDELIPRFERQSGYRVKVVAVGSGAALALGERGEADLVLAHAPAAERALMRSGAGAERRMVMYNDLIIGGPPSDPASLRGTRDATAALRAIAASASLFVSRGDSSGTHQLEQTLWSAAGSAPAGQPWYIEAGAGMGQTLQIADQRGAYTLADRGTFLALRGRLALVPLVEGDPRLLNVYHVIAISPERFPKVNAVGARALIAFLLDAQTQAAISAFGAEKFGQPLFTACGDNRCRLPIADE